MANQGDAKKVGAAMGAENSPDGTGIQWISAGKKRRRRSIFMQGRTMESSAVSVGFLGLPVVVRAVAMMAG